MCVNIRLCILHPWQPPERVLWWYKVSNEDQQKQSLFIIHSLARAKPRFIDVQQICVNLRLCIFRPWQLLEAVLWWYAVSSKDQHQTSLFIIHSLTKAKPRFIYVQHMCVHLRLCIFHPFIPSMVTAPCVNRWAWHTQAHSKTSSFTKWIVSNPPWPAR